MKSPYSSQTVPTGRRIALAALCMAFASPAAASVQATYYVSPSGNDSNPGTEALPFHTVAKARDVVRTVNTTMTGDIVVTLRGGTYPLTSTLTFGNADGGNNGYYVRYVNYPGEKPLLTGGQPITGWTISDAGKNIWKATGVKSRFRQLYVRGTKAIRAREPNLNTDGSANFDRILGADADAHNVQVPSSVVSNWNNLTKVEMHLMLGWGDNILRLASYTTSGNTAYLKFQKTEDDILYIRPYPSVTAWAVNAKAYYFENAYEFLDQPGEWYLDESTNTLYYMARSGENMATATVVAPQLETLVNVEGATTSDPVGNICFQGLAFAHSTFMRPSYAGFLDGQAGHYNISSTADNVQVLGSPTAGVTVKNAQRIRFERNIFTQMAATGLDFVSGTRDDMIVGNVFTDIGGTGVTLGKYAADTTVDDHIAYNPTDKNEISTRDTVKNNFVTKTTTEILGAIGIAAGYPRYIDIEHNEVSNLNYTGISVGFGWTKAENAMTNNKINYNHIHDIGLVLADGSAIYTLSNQGPASEMQYNYTHDYTQTQWADYQMPGLYLDEGTTGYTVAHNVQVNTPGWIAQNVNGTNTLTDNTAVASYSDLDATAQSIASAAGIEAAYADIENNLKIPLPNFGGDAVASDGVFNGTFDMGTTGWTFNVWGGGARGSVIDGEYKIQIDSIGQHNSSIQLVQNGIPLEQGKSYIVKFDAYASAKRTLEANVEQDVNPWTSYLSALQSFNLTTTKTTYSYTFTMTNPTDLNGRLSFNAGASTETVFLDNISIKGMVSGVRAKVAGSPVFVRLENSQLNIKFGAPQASKISIGLYNLNGANVRSGSLQPGGEQNMSWNVDLSGMPRGLYIVRIDADDKAVLRSKFLYSN